MSTASKIDDDCVLVITRDFDAPRRLIWQAWIDFNHAQHWMGPPGHPMKSMEHDLRVGGHWRNIMRHEGKELPQSGVYREIKAPELLSFTFAWETDDHMRGHETLVTVHLEEIAPNKTRMTFQQGVFPATSTRDGHRAGWNRALDAFEQFLSQRK